MSLQEMLDEVRTLPPATRKQWLKALVDVIDEPVVVPTHPKTSLRQYRGVGAYAYDGTDAQAQVEAMRRDWDERP
jgi:hypothetical protein